MWTVVYIAPNQKEAEAIQKNLILEGFLVKLRAIGAIQSGGANSVEVLVPESEVDEAMEVINAR